MPEQEQAELSTFRAVVGEGSSTPNTPRPSRSSSRVQDVDTVTVTVKRCSSFTTMEPKQRLFTILFVTVLVLGLIAILIGTSIEKLEVYEVGIKYLTLSKKLGTEPKTEGLYIGEPGFEFVVFPRVFKTLEWDNFLCINKEGIDIIVDIRLQYKLQSEHLLEMILEFKDFEGYLLIVKNLAGVVIHNTCGHFDTDTIQTNRSSFQHVMRQSMVTKMNDEIFTDIIDLQVDNIQRPYEYEKAIRDKEAAKENVKVALNERPRLLTAANTDRFEALKQAVIQINKAESDAKAIMAKASADAEVLDYSYRTEADAYRELKRSLSLTTEGLLSYMASQLVSGARRPTVNIQPPANSQYDTIANK